MRLQASGVLPVVALAALLSTHLPASPPAASGERVPGRAPAASGMVTSRLFKSNLDLSVVPERIAVRTRAGEALSGALLAVAVPDHEGLAAPGWTALRARDPGAAFSILDSALADPSVAFAAQTLVGSEGLRRMATPDLVVRFEPHVDEPSAERILLQAGAGPVLRRDAFGLARTFVTRPATRDGREVIAVANRLTEDPAVRFAEPDWLMELVQGSIPNDAEFPSQWGLHSTGQAILCGAPAVDGMDMDVPEAWDLSTGTPDVIIVVMDTGAELDHPDLQIDPTLGFDATGEGGGGYPVLPCDDHGTAVIGCIAAIRDNGIGVAGVAPGVLSASARPMTWAGPGCSWVFQGTWAAAAIEWAMSIGARVTNSSWGSLETAVLTDAFNESANAGLLHISIAHNYASSQATYPATLDSVVCVGATGKNGLLTFFSNYGDDQEIVAPGISIRTSDRVGAEGYDSGDTACVAGTSFAAPYVAGIAGLMMSMNPDLSSSQVRVMLRASAVDAGPPGWDEMFGWGRANARRAVMLAWHPGDLDFDGTVGAADLGILLASWGEPGPLGDLDANGVIDAADLGGLLATWTGP